MDLDKFDISNYISVGDQSANLQANSSTDQIVFHHVVTAIPTELPDATLAIEGTGVPEACNSDSLEVALKLFNTNSTDTLPANVPISFFLDNANGDPVFSTTVNSPQQILIGDSLSLNATIPVPPGTPQNTLLTVTANLNQAGESPVRENNLQNNSDSLQIELQGSAPPAFSPEGLSQCGQQDETVFNLWNALQNVDTTGFEIAFFETAPEAENNQNPIQTPDNFTLSNNSQTVFVRLSGSPGCFTVESFDIDILELPQTTEPTPLTQCGNAGATVEFPIADKINEITGGNPDYSVAFYVSENGAENAEPGEEVFSPFENTQPGGQTVFARVENQNGCVEIVPLELQLRENLEPARESVGFSRCGENATTSFNLPELENEILDSLQLQGSETGFYENETDAENGTSPVNSSTVFSVTGDAILYARVENTQGCPAVVELVLEVKEAPEFNGLPQDLTQCAENENPVFDLSVQNETLDPNSEFEINYYASQTDFQNQNPIQDLENYSPESLPQTILVNLTDPENGCQSELQSFVIKSAERPQIDLGNFQDRVICIDPRTGGALENETPVFLNTGFSQENFTFNWQRDGNPLDFEGAVLEVDSAGTYSVEVVPVNGLECPAVATARVSTGSRPLFEVRQPGGFGENPAIEIYNIRGNGDYEFSVDGQNFRDYNGTNPVFKNLGSGEVEVTGRDRNGCGITQRTITVLGYPKFFTPNQDGVNDRWNIKGLPGPDVASIHIFDRYGKLLTAIDPRGIGWDGTYNGRPLPSSDYWFKVQYPANGTLKTFKAHFTLKR